MAFNTSVSDRLLSLGFPLPWPALSGPSDVLEEPSLSFSGIQVRWGQHNPATTPGSSTPFSRDGTNLNYPFFPLEKKKGSVSEPEYFLQLQEGGRQQDQGRAGIFFQGGKANPTRQKFDFCTPNISPALADTGICWCLWFSCYKQAVAMGTLLLIKAQMYCQEENSSNISFAGQQLCSMCWNVGGIPRQVRGWEQEQQGFPSSRKGKHGKQLGGKQKCDP